MRNFINRYVHMNGLEMGDVIIVKRKGIGFLTHYLVYMGIVNGSHQFSANLIGRKPMIISARELSNLLLRYEPTGVRRFTGNHNERNLVIKRAMQLINSNRRYNLASYNCEHFANYAQYGKLKSNQADIGKGIAASVALLVFVRVMRS